MKNTNIFHMFIVTFHLSEYNYDFNSFGGKINLKWRMFNEKPKEFDFFPANFQLK